MKMKKAVEKNGKDLIAKNSYFLCKEQLKIQKKRNELLEKMGTNELEDLTMSGKVLEKNVEKKEKLNKSEFLEKYLKRGKPVVIKNQSNKIFTKFVPKLEDVKRRCGRKLLRTKKYNKEENSWANLKDSHQCTSIQVSKNSISFSPPFFSLKLIVSVR